MKPGHSQPRTSCKHSTNSTSLIQDSTSLGLRLDESLQALLTLLDIIATNKPGSAGTQHMNHNLELAVSIGSIGRFTLCSPFNLQATSEAG